MDERRGMPGASGLQADTKKRQSEHLREGLRHAFQVSVPVAEAEHTSYLDSVLEQHLKPELGIHSFND